VTMIFSNSKRVMRLSTSALTGLAMAACGTTYAVPDISTQSSDAARAMFSQEAALGLGGGSASPSQAAARFERVIARIEPVAENFCRSQMAATRPDYNCDISIIVDTRMRDKNAYQTKAPDGTPIIAFSIPMLMDARNDDEIAFVLGHEYGHHIATHLEKAEKQAVAGALVLGALMAASQGYAASADPYRYTGNDQANLENAMSLGAAVGNKAYSQTYELEADVIATHVARTAGFDAVKGARYFARPENPHVQPGQLSFWGTHPANDTRLALVIETSAGIDGKQGLRKVR